MKEMALKNIDKCIVSLFFNARYNQTILYGLERCIVKENLCIYYKGLKYKEYLFLKTIFKSHKLFLTSYKMIRNKDVFYIFSFSIDKDKERLINIVSKGYYHFLTSTVKKHIFDFTSINLY